MTVNELATKLNVAPDTVRYYTRIGLLQPERAAGNGYRQYSARDEQRLRFALRAKLLGFTLRDIQEIVDHAETGSSPCPMVRNLIVKRVAEVRAQLREAQALFDRMEEALRQWDGMPDGMPHGDSICHLVEGWDVPSEADAPIPANRQACHGGTQERQS